jgi:hypothetical protein
MKAFSDGEFVKKCIITAVKEICPEKEKEFQKISLSRQTVTRRIENISSELTSVFQALKDSFEAYSLSFDESTDVCDTAQLSIFIRGVDNDFNIFEEMLDLVGMKDTTTGLDVKNAVIESIDSQSLNYNKLVGLTTDGAPAMRRKNKGAVVLILLHLKSKGVDIEGVVSNHCFIHLENLCAPIVEINEVMTVVISTINKIKANSLKHRQFREYLNELELEYGDLLYFSKIQWLSRGRVLGVARGSAHFFT